MKKLLLLEPVRKKGNHQFFMDWFARAWQACGGGIKRRRPLPWPALLAVARLKLSANLPPLSSRRNALLVPGAGYPDSFAWPHAYTHEIIPMLWDVWPRYWPRLISSLKRHRVRTFLCTSSQVCEHVRKELPRIRTVHVPEGIDPAGYLPGKDLRERPADILELGRQMPFFHRAAVRAFRNITGLKNTGKLLTIPNPVTVENREFRYDPAFKKKELLFVGRLEPNQKRVSRVLETWALLEPRFPDWTLRLVGDGPEKEALQAFCAERRLERVSFEGFRNPAPYYEQASLLLLASEYEGLPLVVVEGMSFGAVPLLYGSFSSAYDLVDHGQNGCILPASGGFQARQMADMAAGLMQSPAALHAMAREAAAKSRKFTREHVVRQWEEVFRNNTPTP